MDTAKQQALPREIPSHILRHFHAQSRSGRTFRDYSVSAGLSPLTFYSWRKRYGKRFDAGTTGKSHTRLPPSNNAFTTFPAHLLHGSADPHLEITLSNGVHLRVFPGATAAWFAPFYHLLSGNNASC